VQARTADQAAYRVGSPGPSLPDPVAVGKLKARALQMPVARDLEVDPDPGRLQTLDKAVQRAGVRPGRIDVRRSMTSSRSLSAKSTVW